MSKSSTVTPEKTTDTTTRAKRAPRRPRTSTIEDVMAVVDVELARWSHTPEEFLPHPEGWGDAFRKARRDFEFTLEQLDMHAGRHAGVDIHRSDFLEMDELTVVHNRYVKVFCLPEKMYQRVTPGDGHGMAFAVLDARARDQSPHLWVAAEELYSFYDPQETLCALLDVINACPSVLRKMGVHDEPSERDEHLDMFQWKRRPY